MLIGIDGSTETPSVLPTAVDWARELDLDIHLAKAIHPWTPPRPTLSWASSRTRLRLKV
jgi:hypothetical protein